jgi:hypothetical protein
LWNSAHAFDGAASAKAPAEIRWDETGRCLLSRVTVVVLEQVSVGHSEWRPVQPEAFDCSSLPPSSGTDQLPRDRWQSPDVRLLRLASPTARFTYQIEPGG